METLDPIGGQLLVLLVIAAVLLIGLFVIKIVFKLTMNFVKLGCLFILIIMLALFFIVFLTSAV
ncbi:MAG TPA: hypothetical protein ENN19_06090 [Chloroflexi bacterium]|nr:hypothetical protein [Chloroflexota bacterium]